MPKPYVAVRFNNRCELEVSSFMTDTSKSIRCVLTRMQAQALANEILSLTGPTRKGLNGQQDSVLFPAMLREDAAPPKATKSPVRLAQKTGAVYLKKSEPTYDYSSLPQSATDPSRPKW